MGKEKYNVVFAISNMTETTAHFERSDTCAVEACAVVAESRIACVLANEIMLTTPCDTLI